MGHTVIGIDSAKDGIDIVRKAHPDVRLELYSAYDELRATTEPVDIVVHSEVIVHLFRPQHVLSNAFWILRPGGSIILITPYHGRLKNLTLSIPTSGTSTLPLTVNAGTSGSFLKGGLKEC
jgi:2-polyprenyl-3-methyl-5-hydroxy-6-metoxy-1,4-benzoquinol methylase